MGFFDAVSDIFGGSKAKTDTTIDTSVAADLLTQNIMNCASTTTVNQSIQIVGDYNVVSGTKQVQVMKFSGSCSNTSKNVADLQSSITTALENAIKTQSQALMGLLGASQSDINTKISNQVKSAVTQQTISNIINTANANQTIAVNGSHNIVKDAYQQQLQDIVYKNSMDTINNISIIQDANNQLKNNADVVQNNSLNDIVKSVGDTVSDIMHNATFITIALIIAICILALVFIRYGGVELIKSVLSTTPNAVGAVTSGIGSFAKGTVDATSNLLSGTKDLILHATNKEGNTNTSTNTNTNTSTIDNKISNVASAMENNAKDKNL